jgi:hypothetical protein
MNLFKPQRLFKFAWIAFGLTGLVIVFNQYFPNLIPSFKNSSLIKGVQTEMAQTSSTADSSTQPAEVNLKNLDPQEAAEVIAKIVSQEVSRVIQQTSTQVKEFPQKQVRKIKIGACEELLEEDICSVARELDCASN